MRLELKPFFLWASCQTKITHNLTRLLIHCVALALSCSPSVCLHQAQSKSSNSSSFLCWRQVPSHETGFISTCNTWKTQPEEQKSLPLFSPIPRNTRTEPLARTVPGRWQSHSILAPAVQRQHDSLSMAEGISWENEKLFHFTQYFTFKGTALGQQLPEMT